MTQQSYETVIGLEVHIQLATESKAFCGDDASFGGDPNTHISVVSLGHPGTLPRMNTRQIELAVRLGLALGCDINLENSFDRKNYFYADLPKGYQITQDNRPICIGGALPIKIGEEWRTIGIHHIHMEEDAGKSNHNLLPRHSVIDLNRAGVPLLEVVTEPDLRSAEEVDAFMSGMRQLVRYLQVSDGNMEQGSMRCDVNLSIREHGTDVLNERCEIKNVNSMKYARQAIAYEYKRQSKLVTAGERVQQQTLNFDPETGRTTPIRDKEDAHDYRYFPEPDMPPILLDEAFLDNVRPAEDELPWTLHEQLTTAFGLSDYDATILTEELDTALFFLALAKTSGNNKASANLIINKVKPFCQEENINVSDFPVSGEQLAAFLELIERGKVSNTIAYQRIFPELVKQPETAPLKIAETLNVLQSSDSDFLEELIQDVLDNNADAVDRYRKGKKGLLGFFMGEIMKKSKGKADPKRTNVLLRKALEG